MTAQAQAISSSLPWIPPRAAPVDQLEAAYAHAQAGAVPLMNGSWNARTAQGRAPALLLDLSKHPDARAWLAQIARLASESDGQAELYLLDAPAGALMLLLVQTADLIFWCAFNLSADNERAMAAVLLRERRVGLSDGPTNSAGNGMGGLVPIDQITIPDADRMRALMPETMPGAGQAVTLPPLVARAITVGDGPPPARVAFIDSPRVRLAAYASPRLMQSAQRFIAGNPQFDRATRPDYHTVTADQRSSLEEARLQSGWRCVRMVNLAHARMGAAQITTEIVLAYRGAPDRAWSELAAAIGRPTRAIPQTTLIYAWFLARSAPLDDAQRLGWLPVCEALVAALPDLPGDLESFAGPDLVDLAERAQAVWTSPRAARDAARQADGTINEETRRALALVNAAGRWNVPPPTPHATCTDLHPVKIAAMAAWQHLARNYDAVPLSPAAQSWIGDGLRHIWRSWPDSPSTSPPPTTREWARQAGESLVREIGSDWAGSIGTDLPPGYEALRELGVAEIWIDAPPGAPCGWVRLVPADSLGGLVVPWMPDTEPPKCWRLVLRWEAAIELHLLILAILRDYNRAGADQVLIRTASEEPAADHASRAEGTSGPRRRGRTTTALPRGAKEIIHLGGRLRPPQDRGQYVSDEERAEIERQVADLHGVRAHFYRFAPNRPRRPRAAVRELWAQLTDAEKLLHFRTTELPTNATVRGLTRLPDGRWSFRYQRGQYDPERAPRRIVAQGALLVAGALKLIREERGPVREQN